MEKKKHQTPWVVYMDYSTRICGVTQTVFIKHTLLTLQVKNPCCPTRYQHESGSGAVSEAHSPSLLWSFQASPCCAGLQGHEEEEKAAVLEVQDLLQND